MSITVLLGAQWGDEGKGRITDALAAEADVVARFNGGDNAGHSITIGKQVVKLHLIPSGIFRPDVLNVVGNGVVFNPRNLLKEIAEVHAAGIAISPTNLKLSEAAHVILPGHIALDVAREATGKAQGSTKRGIAFAYMDKSKREGLRAGLMREPERFGDAVHAHTQDVNASLKLMGQPMLDADALAADYAQAAQQLKPHLANTFVVMRDALAQNKRVLAEGAQAVLLDLDHGTYPYVTSSNATIGGVMTGLGVPPQAIGRVVGVAKAFGTRVGLGPFATEVFDDLALRLRGTGANPWDEYGSTTGRPRRTGWLDAVALRYAVQMNGITELALTKMDILSGLETRNVAVAYDFRGEQLTEFPQDSEVLAQCKPVYAALLGWADDVSGVRSFADLPKSAQSYVAHIEELVGCKASLVSVGPEREQLIVR
jgi:adenylosuccinate synthase